MNASYWQQHAWVNRVQTALLVIALIGVSALAGAALVGRDGALIAVLACCVALLIQPVASSRLTLQLYKAQPLPAEAVPMLWQLMQQIARNAGLSQTPQLYYVPSAMINAFAVGRRQDAAVALTDGILRTLTPRELAGVLAHEVAHILHDDLRVMGLADYVSRLTGLLGLFGKILVIIAIPWWFIDPGAVNWTGLLILLIAPHLALLMQLGLSRVREFDADLKAASLTGDPMGLASALNKIERVNRGWMAWVLPGWGNPEPSWLRTHPATEERIRRLRAMEPDPDALPALGRLIEEDLLARYRLQRPRWFPGGFWR